MSDFHDTLDALNLLFEQLRDGFLNFGKILAQRFCLKGRVHVSDKAKYHKITDNNSLNIDLLVHDFGSNTHCYYSKMDR